MWGLARGGDGFAVGEVANFVMVDNVAEETSHKSACKLLKHAIMVVSKPLLV